MINALGTELCKIYTEPSLPAEGKSTAWSMIEQVTPYLLRFLANEFDDTSSAIFPFVNDMLYIVSIFHACLYTFINLCIVQETKETTTSIFSRST